MSNYKLAKINNCKVIKLDFGKPKKILHKDTFDCEYFNAFLCGMTGSGKTGLVYSILKYITFCDDTTIIIVSSTFDDCKIMKKIINDFGETNELVLFDHLDDDVFDQIMNILRENKKDEHKKYIYAKTILVIDDTKEYLRDKRMYDIISKVRHYLAHVIILSQSCIDLDPRVRGQLKFLFLFNGFGEEELKKIHKTYIGGVNYDDFRKMYEIATYNPTKEDHNALYISLVNKDFRKNLDEQFIK